MANRTLKMYGKAYGSSVSITVNFNSTQVFSGTVPSVEEEVDSGIAWADMDELCSFTVSTDISGNIPLTIDVSGGDLVYHTIHSNYSGPIFAVEEDDYVPGGDVAPNTLVTATADNYQDISYGEANWQSTESSSGKTNCTIDGIAQSISYGAGDSVFSYTFYDGSTFACDTYVTAAVTDNVFPFNL